MRTGHLIIVVATLGLFFGSFFITNLGTTGLVVHDDLGLERGNIEVRDDSVSLSWTTNKKALSMLEFNGQKTAFEPSTSFSKKITGLNVGTEYTYTIRACDEINCQEKTYDVITTAAPTNAITGNVVANDVGGVVKTGVGYVLFALIGMVALVVGGRVGFQSIASKDPVGGMIKRAEKHIDNEDYELAHEQYTMARQSYTELEEEAKLKHYDSLLRIYHSLKQATEIQEAQNLAEKYSAGTISPEEIKRLNELMMN